MGGAAGAEPPLHVVAGALIDARGRVLIAERPAGKAQAGRWEFPGGKVQPGEAARDALKRELAEELGIDMGRATPLLAVEHRYPGASRAVLIDCWRVESWRGEPSSLDGQRLRWCEREALALVDILEADRPIVTALRLPRVLIRVAPGAAPPARPGPLPRAGWLLDADAPAPGAATDARLIAVSGRPGAFRTAPGPADPGPALTGCVVGSAAEARAARAAGADFLLVPDGTLDSAELAAIAAVALPWYLNRARPIAPGAPPATGLLWWPAPPRCPDL